VYSLHALDPASYLRVVSPPPPSADGTRACAEAHRSRTRAGECASAAAEGEAEPRRTRQDETPLGERPRLAPIGLGVVVHGTEGDGTGPVGRKRIDPGGLADICTAVARPPGRTSPARIPAAAATVRRRRSGV
jgi:hypothetical protein